MNFVIIVLMQAKKLLLHSGPQKPFKPCSHWGRVFLIKTKLHSCVIKVIIIMHSLIMKFTRKGLTD